MKETVVGKVVLTRELLPSDFHLSIRGNGKATLVVAGEVAHLDGDHFLPVLHEAVLRQHPSAELLDVGPGPVELAERVKTLEMTCNDALAGHQEKIEEAHETLQRLVEAETANEVLTQRVRALEGQVLILEQEKQRLVDALDGGPQTSPGT